MKKRAEMKFIDLFSGAGGMTLGFSRLSGCEFAPVWANDFNDYAAATYVENFGNHCVCGDIADILKSGKHEIPRADVVIGGPPCQGFSLLNKNREGDPRNQLWRPFFDVVAKSGASVFVMENVPAILGTPEHQMIERTARRLGYKTWAGKLCAADYGVPQKRYRAFIVGCVFADPARFFPPKKTHFDPDNGYMKKKDALFDFVESPDKWITVREAIADLPPPAGFEIRQETPPLNLHFGRRPTETSVARYKAIPKEGMNRFDLQARAPELTPECWRKKASGGTDLFGRLWWNKPALTIRTEFYKPEKGRYLHPEQHRPITHREAARLQTFPDEFVFKGTKIEVAKQIGNAVPPKLAAEIAKTVRRMFSEES